MAAVIISAVGSCILGLILEFFVLGVDYSRSENLQFEDDEYYYYVKAVPKMTVAAPEKRVKRITTQRVSQNIRHSHNKGKNRK